MSGTLEVRRLDREQAVAEDLAAAAGVHGVYVRNALLLGERDGLVFFRAGRPSGVCWFGPRGNLVIVADEACCAAADEVAEHVRRAQWPWRIVLGAAPLVEALGRGLPRPALAQREQVYYVGDPASVPDGLVRDDLRAPVTADRERLARATLALNASDLNIPPSRVDRRWLYGTIDERIADGTTRVLGPAGGLWCKLDYGSSGPAGTVLEGVFTFPERRGRGLGTALVASCIDECGGAVSLHVAVHNRAARRAYERAGMREAGVCRLLLLG